EPESEDRLSLPCAGAGRALLGGVPQPAVRSLCARSCCQCSCERRSGPRLPGGERPSGPVCVVVLAAPDPPELAECHGLRLVLGRSGDRERSWPPGARGIPPRLFPGCGHGPATAPVRGMGGVFADASGARSGIGLLAPYPTFRPFR